MTILALESSAKSASVAVMRDKTLIAQSFQNKGLTHSQTLMPMTEALLQGVGMTMSDIDLVAVTVGPGSFTGLRIGVATAAGLAWAGKLPCVGISSLEACARGVSHVPGLICAAMDARRGEVYGALFETGADGTLTRFTEDMALPAGELLEQTSGWRCTLVGDGAALCYQTALAHRELRERASLTLAPEHLRFPLASSVALLAFEAAERGETVDAFSLTPKYLRVSQAERERETRLAGETKRCEVQTDKPCNDASSEKNDSEETEL